MVLLLYVLQATLNGLSRVQLKFIPKNTPGQYFSILFR